jgi:hypothetical protein
LSLQVAEVAVMHPMLLLLVAVGLVDIEQVPTFYLCVTPAT